MPCVWSEDAAPGPNAGDIEELSLLKVDLHLHTAEDPLDIIRHDAVALVDRASELGFGAIAITLHERQLASPALEAHARDRGIVLLPGVELTIERKHVLAINFPQGVENVQSLDDLAWLKSRCNGLVIAPHPFFPDPSCLRGQLDKHVDLFDAVEWSYFWTRATNFNARAARWAERHGKPVVGNSDLHDLRQLGRTFSLVDADPDVDGICDAIRAGRVTLRTQPVPVAELTRTLGGMLVRGRRAVRTGREVPITGV
jgi:predicted metal-dependent phosphoesterase TrpH